MTNLQLYLAIGLPVFVTLATGLANLTAFYFLSTKIGRLEVRVEEHKAG